MSNLSIVTKILKPLETSSSIGMFARDTGGCLLARVGLSRSKNEAKEVTFAEISESAIFYFSAPALAKATSKLYSKLFRINKKDFNTPLKNLEKLNIDPKTLKNIKLGKFAQIGTTFGIILPFVFAIAPVRNLLTLADSGKNKFISLIGLDSKKNLDSISNHDSISNDGYISSCNANLGYDHGTNSNNIENKKEALSRAKKLIKNLSLTAGVALSLVGLTLGFGKNDRIYKKIEPLLTNFIKKLEFTKTGDLELSHYGFLIYPVSILSYFSACRDKYEVLENIRRFSITVPLLFFGEKIFSNPIYQFFDKKFNTKVMDSNNNILTYNEILKMPKNTQKNYLKSKNFSYATTFLINTIAIAGAVALLNRLETKRQYNKESANTANQISTLRTMDIKEFRDYTRKKNNG